MAALPFAFSATAPPGGGDILAGALALASRGLPVFPCLASKAPATVRGFKDASTDPAVIRSMFGRPCAAAIGIPTGSASGLIAVDIDKHGERDGMAWLADNQDALPDTLTHGTPSGGLHLLFRAPEGVTIGNSAGRLAPGVDVRGDGGYILVPPSPGYTIMHDCQPADMPVWLVKECMPPERPAVPEPSPAMAGGDRADRYADAALDGECGAVMRAPEGQRNDRLNVAALKLGTRIGAGLLDRGAVEAALRRAALAAGLDPRETEATIRSGIEAGLATPRPIPERERPAAGAKAGAQPAQDAPPVDGADLLTALDAATWAGLDLPPERRILGDLLTATSRAFIVGGTGLGKTQLAHAMAAGIASGDGFLHWRSDGPARVLVIDGEMSKALIRDRMAAVIRRNASAIPAGNLVVYALDRSEEFAERFPGLGQFEPLNTLAGHAFVKRLIGLLRPDAVIFDNVMSLIAGDQKDEVPWSETVPLVSWITSRGVGQMWLDHTGHDRSRQYGSATKAWRFDAVGIMSALPDADQKQGEVAFALSFESPGKARRRTPANWAEFAPSVIRLAGDKWTAEAAGPGGKPIGPVKLQPSVAVWYDALLDALCVSTTPLIATKEEWFAEGVRRSLTEHPAEGDTATIKDAKRAKFRKAVAALVTAGWVSVDGEQVRDLIGGKRP